MDRKLYTYETLKFDFLKDNKKKKKVNTAKNLVNIFMTTALFWFFNHIDFGGLYYNL